jgi:peptide-methionine (R)-S-oxide reductase
MPRRRLINLAAATTAMVVSNKALAGSNEFAGDAAMAVMNRVGKVKMADDEWKTKLKDEPYAYEVLRHEATERPFSSPLNSEKRTGTFTCAGCGVPLFKSSDKYDSGTGWPSFVEPISKSAVTEVPDYSIIFLPRTEVRCANCQGHLGHVFDDGPKDRTGLRYCMNGVSLHFDPAVDA